MGLADRCSNRGRPFRAAIRDSAICRHKANQSNNRKPTNPWPNRVPIPMLIHRRRNKVPVGFPRRSRRWIVAILAALLSPSSNRCCDMVRVATAPAS